MSTEKPDECENCGWKTEELTHHATPLKDEQGGWLCVVCFSTFAGNAFLYPRQYENVPLFQTVAWGINYIADKVDKLRAEVARG